MPGACRRASTGDGRDLNLYDVRVIRVEFTVEPFVEGQPGPHVLAAVSAAETAGVSVEFGPFASEFEAESTTAFAAVSALIESAYANGATHVNIHIEKLDA